MKQIINGKKYDTDTATYVGMRDWWDDSVNATQLEKFYLKNTGELFRHDDKRTTWGNIYDYEKIIPLTLEEAKYQLEEHLSVEKYEELFGVVEE